VYSGDFAGHTLLKWMHVAGELWWLHRRRRNEFTDITGHFHSAVLSMLFPFLCCGAVTQLLHGSVCTFSEISTCFCFVI